MKRPEQGEAVRLIQQALIDLGYPMPKSTRKYGSPDGIYGNETLSKVKAFQKDNGLRRDGVVGRNTMAKFDSMLPAAAPRLPPLPAPPMYVVPGVKNVIAQPTNSVCWATVYAMMRSWKDRQSYSIRHAVALVDEKYGKMVDNNQGLPSSQFGPFIRAAGMRVEPMANLPISEWVAKLKDFGLLWVGTMFSVTSGLHSRIIEGMTGSGTYDATWMMIIDPWGGKRYRESFARFLHKYENAIVGVSGQYYQIRHF
jgi:hypothetical protein